MNPSEKLLSSLKKETDTLIKKYPQLILAIWVTTPDEILSNDDLTFIMLINDDAAFASQRNKLEKNCLAIEAEILKGEKEKLHSSFVNLTEYFSLVMENEIGLLRTLHSSIPIYDPSGFFLPLKKLTEQGIFPGSSKSLDKMNITIKNRLKTIESLKVAILEHLSLSGVYCGQAVLMAKGSSIPHQRMVDEELVACFKQDKNFPNYYAKGIEEMFEFFKKVEHGKVQKVRGSDLDTMMKLAKIVYDKTEDLIAQAASVR